MNLLKEKDVWWSEIRKERIYYDREEETGKMSTYEMNGKVTEGKYNMKKEKEIYQRKKVSHSEEKEI